MFTHFKHFRLLLSVNSMIRPLAFFYLLDKDMYL